MSLSIFLNRIKHSYVMDRHLTASEVGHEILQNSGRLNPHQTVSEAGLIMLEYKNIPGFENNLGNYWWLDIAGSNPNPPVPNVFRFDATGVNMKTEHERKFYSIHVEDCGSANLFFSLKFKQTPYDVFVDDFIVQQALTSRGIIHSSSPNVFIPSPNHHALGGKSSQRTDKVYNYSWDSSDFNFGDLVVRDGIKREDAEKRLKVLRNADLINAVLDDIYSGPVAGSTILTVSEEIFKEKVKSLLSEDSARLVLNNGS